MRAICCVVEYPRRYPKWILGFSLYRSSRLIQSTIFFHFGALHYRQDKTEPDGIDFHCFSSCKRFLIICFFFSQQTIKSIYFKPADDTQHFRVCYNFRVHYLFCCAIVRAPYLEGFFVFFFSNVIVILAGVIESSYSSIWRYSF